MERKVKSRFVAYQLFNGKKRLPGLLTVMRGRMVPELGRFRKPYLAALSGVQDVHSKEFLSCFDTLGSHKKILAAARRYGATRYVKVIMEQEYVDYK